MSLVKQKYMMNDGAGNARIASVGEDENKQAIMGSDACIGPFLFLVLSKPTPVCLYVFQK